MEIIEERDKNIYWKIKGIASKTTYRMFSKYGNSVSVADELIDFSK